MCKIVGMGRQVGERAQMTLFEGLLQWIYVLLVSLLAGDMALA